jgi:hypothetical protein
LKNTKTGWKKTRQRLCLEEDEVGRKRAFTPAESRQFRLGGHTRFPTSEVFTESGDILEGNSSRFQKALDNVYCSRCRTVVRIVNFSGAIKGGDLLLSGRCAVCAGTIARLIEAPGT